MFDEMNLEFYCQTRMGINPIENPTFTIAGWELNETYIDEIPKLKEFQLKDIDETRQFILKNPDTPITLEEDWQDIREPFNYAQLVSSLTRRISIVPLISQSIRNIPIKVINLPWVNEPSFTNEITVPAGADDEGIL